MIDIYGIKSCDSVKKAIKFFKEHDIEYNFYDFKDKSVNCDKITLWLKSVEMKTLFNSRSTTYRNLKLKELNPDDSTKKEYLCKHNLLIKRPVIEYNDQIIVGFNLSNYEGVFL